MAASILKTVFIVLFFFNVSTAFSGFPAPQHTPNWDLKEFLSAIETPSVYRQIALTEELLSGNFPESMLAMSPVVLEGKVSGIPTQITLLVTNDYLRLGDNSNSLVIPLTNYAAQLIASRWDFILPTKALVDSIWQQSDVQLAPQPTDWYKKPGEMRKASNYLIYEERIQKQLAEREGLISGHHKDIVITNRLNQKPDRVAIYGWHWQSGNPIQPLSLVHGLEYEDYSHGTRLLAPMAKVKNRNTGIEKQENLQKLLTNPNYKEFFGETLTNTSAARRCPNEFSNHFGFTCQ